MLHGFRRDNGHVEHVQRRMGHSTTPRIPVKGTAVFSLIALIAIVSVSGIVASVVVTARDGYRRAPEETFARTV